MNQFNKLYYELREHTTGFAIQININRIHTTKKEIHITKPQIVSKLLVMHSLEMRTIIQSI